VANTIMALSRNTPSAQFSFSLCSAATPHCPRNGTSGTFGDIAIQAPFLFRDSPTMKMEALHPLQGMGPFESIKGSVHCSRRFSIIGINPA